MKKYFIISASILLITGCASSPPTVFFKVDTESNWQPGKGPLLSELITIQQENINELADRISAPPIAKGKFESDADFENRKAKVRTSAFMVVPLQMTKERNCESIYDANSQKYRVDNCLPFLSSRVVSSNERFGKPFTLSNAYTSRQIQTKISTNYRILATFDWKTEYTLPLEDAKKLDSDIYAGILMESPRFQKTCSLCESRKSQDSLAELASSIAAFNGKGSQASTNGWRDAAFREGEIWENWDLSIIPNTVKRVVIFRKSDQRVLSDKTYILSNK